MSKDSHNAILWWAAAGFALLLLAWTAFFLVASRHRPAEVPLATQPKH